MLSMIRINDKSEAEKFYLFLDSAPTLDRGCELESCPGEPYMVRWPYTQKFDVPLMPSSFSEQIAQSRDPLMKE